MEINDPYNPNDFEEVAEQIIDDNTNRIVDIIEDPNGLAQIQQSANRVYAVATAEGANERILSSLERMENITTQEFDNIYDLARTGQLQFANGQPVPQTRIKQAYSDMFETQRFLNDTINGMQMDMAMMRGDRQSAQNFAKLVSTDRYNQYLIQQRAFDEDERKE
jgi:hypothetical protein